MSAAVDGDASEAVAAPTAGDGRASRRGGIAHLRALRGAGLRAGGWFAVVALAVLLVCVFAAKFVAPDSPYTVHYGLRLASPSGAHLFGTDQFGRDVLSRIIWGTRSSLTIAFLAPLIGVTCGAVFAIVTSFRRGPHEFVSERCIDALMTIPVLILAMTVVSVLNPSTASVIAAVSVALIPQTARPVRSVVLSLRDGPLIEAARSLGARWPRILIRYIVPNCFPTYVALFCTYVGWALVVSTSLSFLGFGPPPPVPSWGDMLAEEGREYMSSAPWLTIFPGLAIALTVIAFNLLGDFVVRRLTPGSAAEFTAGR